MNTSRKLISDFLKKIDFSKVSYGFHINGNENYTTSLGGSLYLFLVIFLLYFIVNSAIEFISRKNYSSMLTQRILPRPPELNMTEYMLKFGLAISYDDNSQIPQDLIDKYFIQSVNFVSKIGNNKTKMNLRLRKCLKEDLMNQYNLNDDFFKNSKFLNFNCLQNSNHILNASFNDEVFNYIEYSISLNTTAVQNEKMNFSKNFYSQKAMYAMIKYFDFSIDMDNIISPIQAFESEYFDYINFNLIKKVNLDFAQYSFVDDQNILLSSNNFKSFSKLQSVNSYFFENFERNLNDSNDKLLFKFYFRSSVFFMRLKRTYKKLPNFLSDISGLASNFLFLIILFNNYYNKFKSKEELINSLLKFRDNFSTGNILIKTRINYLMKQFNKKIENQKEKQNKNQLNNPIITSSNEFIQENSGSKNLQNNQINDFQDNHFIIKNNNRKIYKTLNEEFKYANSFGYPKKKENNTINNITFQEKSVFKNNLFQEFFDKDNLKPFIKQIESNKNQISCIKSNRISNVANDEPLISQNNISVEKNGEAVFNSLNENKINNTNTGESNKEFIKCNTAALSVNPLNYINKEENKIIIDDEKKEKINSSKTLNLINKNNRFFKQILRRDNRKSRIFNFSPFEIFCQFLYCNKQKKDRFDLYGRACKNIDDHLNIYFYLKILQELEIIKELLFNENETTIINFLARPMAYEDETKSTFVIKSYKEMIEQDKDLDKVLHSYTKLLEKNKIKKLRMKLLNAINNDLNYINNRKI